MITLYAQRNCGVCSTVKKLLDKKNIEYELIEITVDTVEKYKEKGVNHTPTLEIKDGTLIVGKAIIDWINQQ